MTLFCYLASQLQFSNKKYQKTLLVPFSHFSFQFLKLLFVEGIISSVFVTNKNKMQITLKYDGQGVPTFQHIRVISKPGKMVYVSYRALTKMNFGLGLLIISTSKGLMTNHSCIRLKLGGTVLCYIN